MKAAATLGAFGVGLAVVFAGAVAVGNAVGPVGTVSEPTHGTGEHGDDTKEMDMS